MVSYRKNFSNSEEDASLITMWGKTNKNRNAPAGLKISSAFTLSEMWFSFKWDRKNHDC